MTAREPTPREGKDSTESTDTDDERNPEHVDLPAAAVRALVLPEEIGTMIEESDRVQDVDMGEDTLLVHSQCETWEAIAEWSDRDEHTWRRLLGWAMPEREDFQL